MADISKIKTLDGTTYDLKDTEARKNISILNQVTTYEQKTGSIVSFETNAANMPIKSIIANIEPIQEGEGDPSPDNVRPISGWTEVKISNSQYLVNVGTAIDFTFIQDGSGDPSKTNIRPIHPGCSILRDDDTRLDIFAGSLVLNEDFTWTITQIWYINYPSFSNWTKSGTSNYWRAYPSKVRGSSTAYCSHFETSTFSTSNRIQVNYTNFTSASALQAYSLEQNEAGMPIQIVYKAENPEQFTLSFAEGIRALTSIGYNSTYTSIDFIDPLTGNLKTIYSGTVTLNFDGSTDIISTMGNIASYAGETLPGTWISSMDVYEEGATPTTGAQVVYELAEPVSYQLANIGQLKTFLGMNNIWCDTGDVTITYGAYLETCKTHTD